MTDIFDELSVTNTQPVHTLTDSLLDPLYNIEVISSETTVSETIIGDSEVIVPVEVAALAVVASTDIVTSVAPTDWVVSLTGINNVTINEFDKQEFKFRRVKDPAENYTDKFEVFMKYAGTDTWNILNGMLTERYTVASLESFTTQLTSGVGLIGNPEIRVGDFKTAWMGELPTNINIWEDESAKMVFSLLTGTPIESLDNISTKLGLMAINSYDGRSKLRIDYNLRTIANVSGTTREFRDYFSLIKFSKKVIHGQNLSAISEDITGIMTSVDANIAALKAVEISGEHPLPKLVADSLSKEGKNMFTGIWEGMVPDIKNLYYLTIVASMVIDSHWNIGGYMTTRIVIERAISSALSSN